MKILMTDDDSDDRLLAMVTFKKLNVAHTIDFVTDGEELMDYLISRADAHRELPDLILLDLNMPKKDGREALKEIMEHPKLRNLEVIIFSTSDSKKDKEYTRGLGARDYIVKPSSQTEMDKIFSKICNDLVSKPGWHYSIPQSSVKKVK